MNTPTPKVLILSPGDYDQLKSLMIYLIEKEKDIEVSLALKSLNDAIEDVETREMRLERDIHGLRNELTRYKMKEQLEARKSLKPNNNND